MDFFKIFSFLWKGLQISLLTSPQPPPDIKFKSSYAKKRGYAQIWKFSPRLPKTEFFKKVLFFEKVSRFRFQRAQNHPPDIKFMSSYARKRGFGLLRPNMENRPQAPKNFSKNFYFSEKVFKFRF